MLSDERRSELKAVGAELRVGLRVEKSTARPLPSPGSFEATSYRRGSGSAQTALGNVNLSWPSGQSLDQRARLVALERNQQPMLRARTVSASAEP